MAAKARYLFIASMDVDANKEAIFNEVYDTEHIPALLKVPGVLSVRRGVQERLTMFIGGEKKTRIAAPPQFSPTTSASRPRGARVRRRPTRWLNGSFATTSRESG